MRASGLMAMAPWRLELFFKSQQELRAQLPFLRRHRLTHLSLTNKSGDDDLLGSVDLLQQALPDLDVCVHYSIKYNYGRSPAAALAKLQAFCSNLQQQSVACPADCHILLVSGGGNKRAFNTVTALQQLAASKKQKLMQTSSIPNSHGAPQQQQQQQQPDFIQPLDPTLQQQPDQQPRRNKRPAPHQATAVAATGSSSALPALAVAFNPYLPDAAEAAAERARLGQKLATGLVGRVYLQMGSDLARLASGLQFIQELVQQKQQPPPQLLGSVFIPSKRLLAQMKFRPWNGVFLSEQYLSSVEAAEAITQQLLAAYATAGVVPLVETAVKTDEELSHVMSLLQDVSTAV